MIRAYGALLRLYPREHQNQFGDEMRAVFAEVDRLEREHLKQLCHQHNLPEVDG